MVKRLGQQWLPPLAVAVLFVTAWYGAIVLLRLPPYLLPPPHRIVLAAMDDWSNLVHASLRTFRAAMAGFVLSGCTGVAAAIIMAQSRVLERSLYPYAILLQTVPIIAVAPIIVVWLGAGTRAIVAISFIIAVFPVISNTTLGLISTDHNLLNLLELYGTSRWQQLLKLRLPHALPHILGGLKISGGLAVIGAIVGEFVAGIGGLQGGLGYLITVAARQLEMDHLFGAATLSCLMGIAVFFGISGVSHLLLRHWHESAVIREN